MGWIEEHLLGFIKFNQVSTKEEACFFRNPRRLLHGASDQKHGIFVFQTVEGFLDFSS